MNSETDHVPYPKAQRSKNCNCCGRRRYRIQKRVGTPTDPDYAVSICPDCDTAI